MGRGPKRKVRQSNGARFLGIVVEVSLGVVFSIFTNDFDGVFVGTDGTIGTETIEEAANDVICFDFKGGIIIQNW